MMFYKDPRVEEAEARTAEDAEEPLMAQEVGKEVVAPAPKKVSVG